MPNFKQPEKIEPISGAEESRLRSNATDLSEESRRTDFASAIEKADVSKVERRDVGARPNPVEIPQDQPARASLMELAKKTSQEVPKIAPTPSDLSTQATRLQQRMQEVQAGVTRIQSFSSDPKVGERISNDLNRLDPKVAEKLSSSLEHIDQGLRDVTKLTKGVEVGAIEKISKEKPPLVRFLTYLTESDKKMNSFMDELGGLKIGEQKLTPDVLMALQIKMGFITQELEFFSQTLSKALESTKTVMNVQI